MKTSDLLAMCVRNLLRRKFRTFLTVTGVVVGTCAIVVMMSLGIGIGKSQEEMLKSYGDLTIINVFYYGSGNDVKLNDEAVAKMQALPNVDVATPLMQSYDLNMNLTGGRKDRYKLRHGDIIGIYPEALEKLGFEIKEGEYFPEKNTDRKKIQLVFGENVAYRFEDTKKRRNNMIWPEPDATGKIPEPFVPPLTTDFKLILDPTDEDKYKPLEYEAEVLGVLKGDWGKGYETMYGAFMNINDMKRLQAEYRKANGMKATSSEDLTYNDVRVKMKSIEHVAEAEKAIKDMGFETYSMESEREAMEKNSRQIQMILGGLGAVSLFVAAISITNTMIMSVYERTREIGIMKVLGCLVGNIRTVFLFEAGLIGFFGGVFGIGISFLLSYIMNRFGASIGFLGNMMGGMGGMGGEEAVQISIIPPWLVLLGMTFATLIGLISGFYPANRAVRISALEAIKQE